MDKSKIKVIVGLSGGVDSAVAAFLLKEEGYQVIAMFMQNWHDTAGTLFGDCPWKDDLEIAELVARQLDIPFHFIDLSVDYKKRVVDYMFNEYEKGRTPNPDVLCNREIKFDAFLKAAQLMGADFVATGHYCRKTSKLNADGVIVHQLLAGVDNNKDQSYFLCQLSQAQLAQSLFPIGHLQKNEVRQIAIKHQLANATRKDSQGICFVGKVDLPVFLQQKLSCKIGNVVEIPSSFYKHLPAKTSIQDQALAQQYQPSDGTIIGQHDGAHFFTVGQRKGLRVGGRPEPIFVIATDIHSNTIYVGQNQQHPGLYRNVLSINTEEIHWLDPANQLKEGESLACLVRIRYRQPLQEATLRYIDNRLYIEFVNPQRGVSPGQFAAWYKDDELLGSGVIA